MNRQAESFVAAAAAESEAHAAGARVGISRPHESAHLHVAGEATYVDDITEPAGTLHAALGLSPVAHGRLVSIDVAALRAYKLSKRFDCDISALAAGLALTLDGDTVRDVRLAFGGMAAIVKRAARAEAALRGQPWSEAAVEAAVAALAHDFTPLTDLRASASYRLRAAGNLLRRFWLETRTEAPLARAQTSVWARGAAALTR